MKFQSVVWSWSIYDAIVSAGLGDHGDPARATLLALLEITKREMDMITKRQADRQTDTDSTRLSGRWGAKSQESETKDAFKCGMGLYGRVPALLSGPDTAILAASLTTETERR